MAREKRKAQEDDRDGRDEFEGGGFLDSDGNEHELFDGDHGDMCADARDAAIALKTRTSVSGTLFEKALAHLDEVERSLNNDMLVLTVDEHYGLMYASPVDVDPRGGHYSLKRATYLSPEDVSALVGP